MPETPSALPLNSHRNASIVASAERAQARAHDFAGDRHYNLRALLITLGNTVIDGKDAAVILALGTGGSEVVEDETDYDGDHDNNRQEGDVARRHLGSDSDVSLIARKKKKKKKKKKMNEYVHTSAYLLLGALRIGIIR
jgi:hypothetical protein